MILSLLRSWGWISLFFLSFSAHARICSVYLERNALTLPEQALLSVNFPVEGRFFIFEPALRKALYEAYEGKDFYTGKPIEFEQMSIDHVIPRSLGGPDHVANYVPTTGATNSAKGSNFYAWDLQNLKDIQTDYVPKVMDLLRRHGAFENREQIYGLALEASRKKDPYKHLSKVDPQLSFPFIHDTNIFRRTMEVPTQEVQNILSLFSKKLSSLTNKELSEALAHRVLQFEVSENLLSSKDLPEKLDYVIFLSSRRNGEKLEGEYLIETNKLFEIVEFNPNQKQGEISITIEFNPKFAKKLLEAPQDKIKSQVYIKELFKPLDITKEEFAEWFK